MAKPTLGGSRVETGCELFLNPIYRAAQPDPVVTKDVHKRMKDDAQHPFNPVQHNLLRSKAGQLSDRLPGRWKLSGLNETIS